MRKQKIIFLFLFLFTITTAYGQEQKKYYLGGHFSYGKTDYSASRCTTMNPKDYKGKDYLTLAIDYAYRTAPNTEFITGLSATNVKMDFTNTVYGRDTFSYTYDDSFNVFSVPAGLRYYFVKYFSINAGANINYHPYMGYNWGFGGFAGLAAHYSFKSGLSFSIAPQAQINILELSNFDENLTQIGVNIGVGYRFKLYR